MDVEGLVVRGCANYHRVDLFYACFFYTLKDIIMWLLIFVLIDIIFMPFAVLWAVNEIFHIGVEMTDGWTWLAVVVLGIFFRGVKR